MDRITLVGIEAWAQHGVLPHERELGQRFLVDVSFEVDLAAAGASDDLADTVDYGTVAARVHEALAGPPLALVEAVAARIADVVLACDERIAGVTVRLHKPAAPVTVPLADVVIEITRPRP